MVLAFFWEIIMYIYWARYFGKRKMSFCMHERINVMCLIPWKRNVFIFPFKIQLVPFVNKHMFHMQEEQTIMLFSVGKDRQFHARNYKYYVKFVWNRACIFLYNSHCEYLSHGKYVFIKEHAFTYISIKFVLLILWEKKI